MSNTQIASGTTGYLTSFALTYQIEGVTEEQAARIAAAVKRTLETNVSELIGAAAESPVQTDSRRIDADRKVLAVRVETRGSLVEEYER